MVPGQRQRVIEGKGERGNLESREYSFPFFFCLSMPEKMADGAAQCRPIPEFAKLSGYYPRLV